MTVRRRAPVGAGLLALLLLALGGVSMADAQSIPLGGDDSSPRLRGLTRYASVSLVEPTRAPTALVGPSAPPRVARALLAAAQDPAQDPVPDDGSEAPGSGGSRFGGPLLWAMVIIGASTVGLLYLGSSLAPPSMVVPPPDEPTTAVPGATSSAGRRRASPLGVGW